MEKLTHWKKTFNPKYLGAHDFQPNEEIIATIEGFTEGLDVVGSGGKADKVTALNLAGLKPFIINATNSKLITKALKTPYIENWIGKSIALYVKSGVRSFDDIVDAVRVRPIAPKTEKPGLDTERFKKMLDSIEAGKFTAEQAKAKFNLTTDQLELLP